MAYATRADLAARFGVGEIDDLAPLEDGASRADAALDDAAAEIDGEVSKVYVTPLAGSWPALVPINCDLGRARLYDDAAPERVLVALSSARKRLREIGAGARRLVDAAGREAPRHPVILIRPGADAEAEKRLDEYLHPPRGY